MTEQLSHLEINNPNMSRRLFVGGGMATVAVATLSKGIRLNKPPLDVRPFYVGIGYGDLQLSPDAAHEKVGAELVTVTPEGKILIQPNGAFFTPGKEFRYVHRGGNSLEAIDEAYAKGANLFDIDANDADGIVRTEHGIILKLGPRFLPLLVADMNEGELGIWTPETYEEAVDYIASMSTPDHPLAISTEMKRIESQQETVETVCAAHIERGIPAILHSPDPEWLASIGDELAAIYNVPR